MRTLVLAFIAVFMAVAGAPVVTSNAGTGNGNNNGNCTGTQCGGGGNSPFVNKFPVNGLLAGVRNNDEQELVSASLHNSKCGSGFTLAYDHDNKRLIGVRSGSAPCVDSDLVNATFTINGSKSIELTITDVKSISLVPGKQQQGYKITYNGKSVCDLETSLEVVNSLSWTHPDHAVVNARDFLGTKENDSDYAIALPGPILNEVAGDVIDETRGSEFFNIACSTDALAKVYSYELATNPQLITAAVRMIIARYGERSFTVPGMHIDFEQLGPASSPKNTGPSRAIREALWDANGKALCIDTPRLRELRHGSDDFPKQLPDVLDPPEFHPTANPCDWDRWESALRILLGDIKTCDEMLKDEGAWSKVVLIPCIQPGESRRKLVLKHGGFDKKGNCSM